jgi:hypothetical protein
MKHRDALRPIGKCKGCCLNFKTHCRAGLEPKATWDRGRCKHYGDWDLLERLQRAPAPEGAKLARRRRQQLARQAATEPHHNAVLDPGKMAGRDKRHSG